MTVGRTIQTHGPNGRAGTGGSYRCVAGGQGGHSVSPVRDPTFPRGIRLAGQGGALVGAIKSG